MKDFVFSELGNGIKLITVLTNEISVHKCILKYISELNLINQNLIIDMALKTGLSKYRFVNVRSSDNKLIIGDYIVDNDLEKMANAVLREHLELLENSMLSSISIEYIKNN